MYSVKESSEEQLVKALQRGDSEAIHRMYCDYVNDLAAVCSRYIPSDNDTWDILHDSFLKAITSVKRFQYRGEGSLRAWLTKIVVNQSLKFLKENATTTATETPSDIAEDITDEEPDTAEIPADVILEMVRELPAGYRTVFNLYVFEEKSHKEIASILNIKENTSASQLHKAKAMLAEKIKRYKASHYE